jgi:hypothetical protein
MSLMLFPLLALLLAPQGPSGSWEEVASSWIGPTSQVGFGVSHSTWLTPDIDGDGVSDVLIGADQSMTVRGAIQLRSGNSGIVLMEAPGSLASAFGTDFCLVDDLDFDGVPDFLIGAPGEFIPGGRGSAIVISSVTGQEISRFDGLPGEESFGTFLGSLGDITGDGVTDFVVGIGYSTHFPFLDGGARAISGSDGSTIYQVQELFTAPGAGGVVGDIDLDGTVDFLQGAGDRTYLHSGADGSVIRFHEAPRQDTAFGGWNALGGLGDLNMDGIPEYAVGATAPTFRDTPGHVYVYDGASGNLVYEFEGIHIDSRFGRSIATVGDTNGDGFTDILIGAPEEGSMHPTEEFGAARLFSGGDGRLLHVFRGTSGPARDVGISVLGLGDVNDDGLGDMLIGSISSAGGGTFNGVWRTYGMRSYLNVFPQELSASAGGTLTFDITFPISEAHRDYRILASNDAPGRTPFFSVNLPLARTPVMEQMVHDPPASFLGARGTLDGNGHATATWTIPPGAASLWADRTLRFSAVTLAGPNDAGNYSAGMRVRLTN